MTANKLISEKKKLNSDFGKSSGGRIDVYWHTIQSSSGQGYLTTSQIQKQIGDLTRSFASGGWIFNLVSIDTTVNDDWFGLEPGGSDEEDMKRSLRRGGSDDLNFYTTKLSSGLLGWATFPWDYSYEASMDGVVCGYETLDQYGYTGDTGVHEVGHWMGLLHTFQGGCTSTNGDYVSDTPAVAEPNYGCPGNVDSCPYKYGKDDVSNFMDYSDDTCMDHFTPGQYDAMQALWNAYRDTSSHDSDSSIETHHDSPGVHFIHSDGMYYTVASVVAIFGLVGGVLYKKKRDQDELDQERLSEWVGELEVDNHNPMAQQSSSDQSVEMKDVEKD